MPDELAHEHYKMIVLSTMMACACKKRRAQQWKDLTTRSTYDAASYASVIVMVSTRQNSERVM